MRCQRCGFIYWENGPRICRACGFEESLVRCWYCNERVGRGPRGNCLRCDAPEVDPRIGRPRFGGFAANNSRYRNLYQDFFERPGQARMAQQNQERQFGPTVMNPTNLIFLALAQLSVNSPELKDQVDTVVDRFESLGNEWRDCSLLYVRYRTEHMTRNNVSDEPKSIRRIRTSPLTKK